MKAVMQRVKHASVVIDNESVGAIEKGILALIGIEKEDTSMEAEKLIKKILKYRIFPDLQQKMNLDLTQVSGGLLLVPQFTLVAQTDKGTRPGFSKGMPPAKGEKLFNYLVNYAKSICPFVATGQFGADMQVNLCNDGPVTFMLQVS